MDSNTKEQLVKDVIKIAKTNERILQVGIVMDGENLRVGGGEVVVVTKSKQYGEDYSDRKSRGLRIG